jgi:hypothetical protein
MEKNILVTAVNYHDWSLKDSRVKTYQDAYTVCRIYIILDLRLNVEIKIFMQTRILIHISL